VIWAVSLINNKRNILFPFTRRTPNKKKEETYLCYKMRQLGMNASFHAVTDLALLKKRLLDYLGRGLWGIQIFSRSTNPMLLLTVMNPIKS
jgi:hypothetical protein